MGIESRSASPIAEALGRLSGEGKEEQLNSFIRVLVDQASHADWVTQASSVVLESAGRKALLKDEGQVSEVLKSLNRDDLVRLADAVLPPEQGKKSQAWVIEELMRRLYACSDELPEKLRDPGLLAEVEDRALSEYLDPVVGPFTLAVFLKEMILRHLEIDRWVEEEGGETISPKSRGKVGVH